MVIREEQIEVLRKNRKDTFTSRTSRFMRGHLPAQTQAYTDEELFTEVEEQIECGRHEGLKSESDLVSFVGFRFMAGSGFRSQGRFGAIWDRPDLDGPVKVARTRDLISASAREKRA